MESGRSMDWNIGRTILFARSSPHGYRTDNILGFLWRRQRTLSTPAVEGYHEDKGRTLERIMRVLNAMYKQMTESNGIAPIPQEVF